MAKFTINGLDDISASFEQLANITDEDKLAVIMPAARLLQEKYKEKIRTMFRQISGALADSISIVPRMIGGDVSVSVTPKGKHPGSGTGKRMKKERNGRRRSSGKYSGSNAEVAYIFGVWITSNYSNALDGKSQ